MVNKPERRIAEALWNFVRQACSAGRIGAGKLMPPLDCSTVVSLHCKYNFLNIQTIAPAHQKIFWVQELFTLPQKV